jgi:hypothetical protein
MGEDQTQPDRLDSAGDDSKLTKLAERTWSVWRLDDSGTRFRMAADLSEGEAKQMVSDFEARGHKQTYWAEIEKPG